MQYRWAAPWTLGAEIGSLVVMGGYRPRVLAVAGVTVFALAAAAFGVAARVGAPEGSAGTDRASRTMAEAISYPRPDDPAGYARAVTDKNGAFTVLAAEPLSGDGTSVEPWVRLVWRIHVEATDDGAFQLFKDEPYDACYRVDFNRYEATSLARIDCPRGAGPVRLPARPTPTPTPTPTTGREPDAGATPTCQGVIDCSQVGG